MWYTDLSPACFRTGERKQSTEAAGPSSGIIKVGAALCRLQSCCVSERLQHLLKLLPH